MIKINDNLYISGRHKLLNGLIFPKYLDRTMREIRMCESDLPEGYCWDVLYADDFKVVFQCFLTGKQINFSLKD